MQFGIARGTAIVAVALGLLVGTANARSLQEMERVAQKAPSLSAFLASAPLLEEYRKAVEAYYGGGRFNCQTFGEVIDELRALTKRVPAVAESIWRPWHHKNSVLILTPDGHAYNFRSVPRKIHTLWSYATENYCENEVCTNLFSENRNRGTVLLGRWTSTIAGSQIQLVEKDGRYSGMALLLTPFKKEGKTFGLVDAYGDRRTLSAPLRVLHTRSGKSLETTLLDAWLETTSAAKPAWLAGFLVPAVSSSTKGIALAQAFSPLKLRPQMDEGFLPVDPLAGIVGKHLAKQCGLSDAITDALKPSVSNGKGGFFQVLANGDPSFGKLIVPGAGASADIFGGELSPALVPNSGVGSAGVVAKGASGAGSGTGNATGGATKSNFAADAPARGSDRNADLFSGKNLFTFGNDGGSAGTESSSARVSPESFGLDPLTHSAEDFASSNPGNFSGGSKKGTNPSHSKNNSFLPQNFANNVGPEENRNPASLTPGSEAAPEGVPAEAASNHRGITASPGENNSPTAPEAKPPESKPRSFGENAGNALRDAVARGIPETGRAVGDAATGIGANPNPFTGVGAGESVAKPETPRQGPTKPEPVAQTPPAREKEKIKQTALQELKRQLAEGSGVDPRVYKRAIDEAAALSSEEREKQKIDEDLGRALETDSTDKRQVLLETLGKVTDSKSVQLAASIADRALILQGEGCAKAKQKDGNE
ncbi:MAG: hypothetical protein KDD51_10260 [Bdellovibrionales bacterium]|nr:hypothetical protein [Bdellovibrionales bacterium]